MKKILIIMCFSQLLSAQIIVEDTIDISTSTQLQKALSTQLLATDNFTILATIKKDALFTMSNGQKITITTGLKNSKVVTDLWTCSSMACYPPTYDPTTQFTSASSAASMTGSVLPPGVTIKLEAAATLHGDVFTHNMIFNYPPNWPHPYNYVGGIVHVMPIIKNTITPSYPSYHQIDYNTANDKLGGCGPLISLKGCLVTSFAMALYGWGINVNPRTLNAALTPLNAINCNGGFDDYYPVEKIIVDGVVQDKISIETISTSTFVKKNIKVDGKDKKVFDMSKSTPKDITEIDYYLQQHWAVIALVANPKPKDKTPPDYYSTHFVLIVDKDPTKPSGGSQYLTNDPGYSDRTNLQPYGGNIYQYIVIRPK